MRIFKKLKVQSVVVSLLYLVLGICLLAVPDAAKRTVCYFAGAMLIVSGLVQIINYFLYINSKRYLSFLSLIHI